MRRARFPGSPVAAGAMTVLAPYTIREFPHRRLRRGVSTGPRPRPIGRPAPPTPRSAWKPCSTNWPRRCGIDPIDLRIMNAVHEGTPSMMGTPYKRIGFIEVCEALKNSPHYKSKLTGKNRGRGVGFGFWFNAGLQSSALVNIHADGTASVVTGNPDIGGSRASMAMIAAEVLGLCGRRRAAQRRRHRLDRPVRRDRRQPGHDGDRVGGLRGRPRCHPPDEGARRARSGRSIPRTSTTSTAR